MKYRKQYINVDVVFDASGRMRPQVIHWVDGRRYEISRVKAIVPAAARKSGGQEEAQFDLAAVDVMPDGRMEVRLVERAMEYNW